MVKFFNISTSYNKNYLERSYILPAGELFTSGSLAEASVDVLDATAVEGTVDDGGSDEGDRVCSEEG